MWCIPPKQNAEFIAHMEDVLEVYSRPFDQKRPVICMDEKPFQLLDEYLEPISMGKDNHSEKYDCEYVRKGSCAIFMFTEPLGGWREAHAYPRRTACDWALQLKWLVDEPYADADKIVLVMDNLNTILPPLSTKRFHLRRHTVLRRSLRSITRQNMGHGWIWLKLSCPRLLFNAF